MAKLTLNNIGSRYGSIDALNDNFDAIETAFENTLSRDGTSPNNMETDLDMDSNDIINVGSISVGSLRINGQPVSPGNINYTGMVKETIVATAGQTVFDLTSVSYSPLTNNLSVYVDGVYQNPSQYTETSSTRVTLSEGVHEGAIVDFVVLSLTAIPGTVDAANVTYTPAGSGAQTTTVATKLKETVSVKDFGAVGDGVTDDTAAIQAAITAVGIGGTILFSGTHAISSTIRPLSSQTWIGSAGCDFLFTATSSSPGVEFSSSCAFASVENIGFRATTGFTGAAFHFNASLNCRVDRAFIRNILNGRSVQFSGGAFYNEARNIRTTSCLFGLYITGTSPNCPNNSIVDNFDVYGSSGVGTALFSDSNCSMFTLRNFISEANCATNVLKMNAGKYEFISPRFECVTTPTGGFYDISGASIKFNGQQFKIQKATHASLSTDLDYLDGRTHQNLVIDPLFIGDFPGGNTPPTGWTVFTGTASSIAKSTTTPNVGVFGSSMEVVTSAANAGLSYTLNSSSVQALMRGKTAKLLALSRFTAPGTGMTVFLRQEGGAGGATQQVSENLVAGSWSVHSCELAIPSDATTIHLRMLMSGNGGTFQLFSPVLSIDGLMYTFSKGGLDRLFFPNGFYAGPNGNRIDLASAAPTTGTWKRGDRVFNQAPAIGQPKSWVCTVAGTPGTWVSEGNL